MKPDPRFQEMLAAIETKAAGPCVDEPLLDLCDRYHGLEAQRVRLLLDDRKGRACRRAIELELAQVRHCIAAITARTGLGRQGKFEVLQALLGRETIAGQLAASVFCDYDTFCLQRRAV